MANANQRELGMMPPVTAGNIPPAVAGAPPPNKPNTLPPTNATSKTKKVMTLAGTVLAESGAGFGVGAMLAKGDVTSTSLLVVVASLIFAFDVALRYTHTPSVTIAPDGRPVFWAAIIATLLLSAMALIPYTIMKTKGKGKAPVAAVPTMASLWTVGALGFTAFQARGGDVMAALQGAILSIMYMALASIAGYNTQTKQAGTGTFAGALWAMLAMFDALGLSRT